MKESSSQTAEDARRVQCLTYDEVALNTATNDDVTTHIHHVSRVRVLRRWTPISEGASVDVCASLRCETKDGSSSRKLILVLDRRGLNGAKCERIAATSRGLEYFISGEGVCLDGRCVEV